MALAAPVALDILNFRFSLQCKLRVFGDTENVPKGNINLLAAASRFGLVFVGCPGGQLKVLQLSTITQIHGKEIKNPPMRCHVLIGVPQQLSLNCDHTILAIVLKNDGGHFIQFYETTSFFKQTIQIIKEVRLNNAANQLSWNPCLSQILALTLSDGAVFTFEFKNNNVEINSLQSTVTAVSLCWSPKGKQLVYGSSQGTLSQLKPDLKHVKTIQIPQMNGSTIINVQWLSSYQFAAVFLQRNTENYTPALVIVNAPKSGPVTCINYDDICYSSSEENISQIYLISQPAWNILIAASANSSEVGVLGATVQQDIHMWQQWLLMDDARAEIPLYLGKEESYPKGIALDTGTIHQLTIGENKTLPPMPMLHLLSDKGVLVSYNVVNTADDAVSICSPPDPIRDGSGLNNFIVEEVSSTGANQKQDKIETIGKSSVQPNQTVGSGDISFMMNTGAITSTPAKSENMISTQKPVSSVAFGTPTSSATLSKSLFGPPPATAQSGFDKKLPISSSQNQIQSAFGSTVPTFGIATTSGSGSSASVFNAPSVNFGSTQSTFSSKPPSTVSTQSSTAINTPKFGSPVNILNDQINLKPNISTTQSSNLSTKSGEPFAISTPTTMPQTSKPNHNQITPIQPAPKYPSGSLEIKSGLSLDSQPIILKEVEPEITEADKEAILKLIKEEVILFQKDFNQLMDRSKGINIKIGNENESKLLCSCIETIKSFLIDAKESTQNQTSEVQCIKQTLVESFSWISEARSRYAQDGAPDNGLNTLKQLHKTATLDLLSRRQLSSITKSLYYVESQLSQLNRQIDAQWSEFQDSCKEQVKGRMHIPSLESIYQALLKQGGILVQQQKLVKDLIARTNKKNIIVKERNNSPNVSKLTKSLLALNLSTQDPNKIHIERALSINEHFPQLKQNALRAALANHRPNRTIPVRVEVPGCKSSVILDRINRIKDKKLVPNNSPQKIHEAKVLNKSLSSLKTQINLSNTEKRNGLYEDISPPLTPSLQLSNKNDSNIINTFSFAGKQSALPAAMDSSFSFDKNKTNNQYQIGSFGANTSKSFDTNVSIPQNSLLVKTPISTKTETTSFTPVNSNTSSVLKNTTNMTLADDKSKISSNTSIIKQEVKSSFNFGQVIPPAKVLDFSQKTSIFAKSTEAETNKPKDSEPPKNLFSFNIPSVPKTAAVTTLEQSVPKPANKLVESLTNSSDIKTVTPVSTNLFNTFSKTANENAENKKTDANKQIDDVIASTNKSAFGGTVSQVSPNQSVLHNLLTSQNLSVNIIPSQTSTSNNNTSAVKMPTLPAVNTTNPEDKKVTTTKEFTFSLPPTGTESAPSGLSVSSTPPVATSNTASSTASLFTFNLDNNKTDTSLGFGDLGLGLSDLKNQSGEISFMGKNVCSPFSYTEDKDVAKTNIFSSAKPDISAETSAFKATTSDATTVSSAASNNNFTGGSGGGIFASSGFGSTAFGVGSTGGSIFANATNKTGFGAISTTKSSADIFGNVNKAETPTANVFGSQSASVFGAKSEQTSVFGSQKQETASVFGQPSPFTAPSPQSNIFGSASKQETSVFGGGANSGNNLFGSAPKQISEGFGQPAFGGSAFGSGGTSGGNLFSSAGGPSSFSGFASPSFGSTGGSVFGGGAFSSGTSVSQGGFGSPPLFNKTPASSGFGAAPAFGGAPSGFGSPPSFGGAPTFGSPTKAFALPQAQAAPAFGSPTQQNATFENLATQSNTMTFGNLAQGTQPNVQANKPAFSGSPSFSSWR